MERCVGMLERLVHQEGAGDLDLQHQEGFSGAPVLVLVVHRYFRRAIYLSDQAVLGEVCGCRDSYCLGGQQGN